jgi:hypothetical protein
MIFQWNDNHTTLNGCYRVNHRWRQWIQSVCAWRQSLLTIHMSQLPHAVTLLPFLRTSHLQLPSLLTSTPSSSSTTLSIPRTTGGHTHGVIGIHVLCSIDYTNQELFAKRCNSKVVVMCQSDKIQVRSKLFQWLEEEANAAIPTLHMIAPLIHTLHSTWQTYTSIPIDRWCAIRRFHQKWSVCPRTISQQWPSQLQHLDIINYPFPNALLLPTGLLSLRIGSAYSIDFTACVTSLTSLIILDGDWCVPKRAVYIVQREEKSIQLSNSSVAMDIHLSQNIRQLESLETVHLMGSFDVVGPHQQLLFPLFGTKLTSLSVSIVPRESSRVPFTKGRDQSEPLAITWSDTSMDIVKWPSLTSLTLNVAEFYESDNFDDEDLIQLDIDVSHTCIPIIMKSTLSSSLSSLRHIHMARMTTNMIC